MNKENCKLIRDCLPLLIDGIGVEIYFPSAYKQEDIHEVEPEAVEAALLTTYRKTIA